MICTKQLPPKAVSYFPVFYGSDNLIKSLKEVCVVAKPAGELSESDAQELKLITQRFSDYFLNVSNSTVGYSQTNSIELDAKRRKLNQVINQQYDDMTAFSGPDFSKFINDALKDPSGNETNLEKVINEDANTFSTFFYERYKNINNKYEDLRMVTEQLCELATAVTTLRDDVTASDGILADVSKTIAIDGISEDRREELTKIIKDIEQRYNLDAKMHDTIVPNTLTYGDFFVFHQPYNRIFSKFELMRRSNPMLYKESYGNETHESVVRLAVVKESMVNGKRVPKIEADGIDRDVDTIYEAFDMAIPMENQQERRQLTKANIRQYLLDKYANIEVINDGAMPLMEDAEITSLSDPNILKKLASHKRREAKQQRDQVSRDLKDIGTPDSVVNTADINQNDMVLPEYKDVSGIYIKLMSPLRTVPVYILDECIGYYLLYETYGTIRNNMLQNNQLNRTSLVFQHVRNKDAATSIVDIIAMRIIQKIDNKYVKNNPKFRELMVNALMYEDLYRKDFKVQFVSAEYITHFKVNEDVETHLGVSMLRRSLFYAKIYMTTLIFKVVSTVTRSNDTRVFYVKQSGIDRNVQNQVQRAAREYKENQISFNDVASVNTLMSKAGHAKDMFVATGKSGERPLEIDIVSGQQVDMNTDFIDFVRKNMINGTDVPAVILEYLDSADFARSIDMGHVKYASKICSVQRELNVPCTDFYRKLIHFEHPEVTEDELMAISYRFNRPKSLTIQNSIDIYDNAERAAAFIVKVVCGENTEKYTDEVKDKMTNYLVANVILPGMYDWDNLQETADAIITQIGQDKKIAKLATTGENDNNNPY